MDNWAQVQLLARLGITTWMRGDSSARLIENEFIRLRTENGRLRSQLEQLDLANQTLSGQNTGLAEDNERLRAPRAWGEVQIALQCLQDDFDGKGAGVSGLRAQAMAHLKQALVLRDQVR